MTVSRILVHRHDDNLDDEVRAALSGSGLTKASIHFHSELRSTINAAVSFQPSLVIIEVTENLEELKTLVEETLAVVPEATILGVYDVNRIPPGQSESALMIQALRLGVEDFMRRPIAATDFQQVIKTRLNARRTRTVNHGKVVSFISNKGGVGKSTTAINTAIELATRHSDRVALIDCSLQMGVCAVQLNLQPEATLVDAWQERERLDEQLLEQLMTVHNTGLHVLAAPANAIDAAEIDDAFLSRILLMARRTYDYVIIDTFPMFDRTVMTILDLTDEAMIIVENVVPTLQMIKGFFTLLEEFDFPIERQNIVLNRFATKSGAPSVSEVARYLNRDPDYVIPFSPKLLTAANTGVPFIKNAPRWNKSATALRNMARDIANDGEPSAKLMTQTNLENGEESPHRSINPRQGNVENE